jgi:hypothetical protein
MEVFMNRYSSNKDKRNSTQRTNRLGEILNVLGKNRPIILEFTLYMVRWNDFMVVSFITQTNDFPH